VDPISSASAETSQDVGAELESRRKKRENDTHHRSRKRRGWKRTSGTRVMRARGGKRSTIQGGSQAAPARNTNG